MLPDCHVHTNYSTDGFFAPEVIVNRAIRLGMKDICLTDHFDPKFPGMNFSFEPNAYIEKMQRVKEEFAGRINVHIGVEFGIMPDTVDYISEVREKYPFEFAIGSLHVMDNRDIFVRDDFKELTDSEFFRAYFENFLKCIQLFHDFDTLGHLDYAIRYGYRQGEAYSYAKYADVIDEILKLIIEKDIALELNSGGIRKKAGIVHPHRDVIARYLELGGKYFTVGSDAHRPSEVGCDFDAVEVLIREFHLNPKLCVPKFVDYV